MVSKQAALIEKLRAEIAALKTEIAILKKNSATSSKPPSSDIVKPTKPKKNKERRRKIGAQKGHKQHLRKVTQGVRSDLGNEWHERFWTVLVTCKRRSLNMMTFLREAVSSLLHGLSPPSLLPTLPQR